MKKNSYLPETRSVLFSFKFVGIALAGSLTMALVATFAPVPAQVAVLGACVSILAGLFVAYAEQEEARERRRAELLERLRIPWRWPVSTNSSTSTVSSRKRWPPWRNSQTLSCASSPWSSSPRSPARSSPWRRAQSCSPARKAGGRFTSSCWRAPASRCTSRSPG